MTSEEKNGDESAPEAEVERSDAYVCDKNQTKRNLVQSNYPDVNAGHETVSCFDIFIKLPTVLA